MADLARKHLVDGDPGPDVGGALLEADAGQERAVAARVVAGAVGAAFGRAVVQAAEDLDQVLARLQRLKGAAEWNVRPLPLRPPGGGDGAVREVDEGRASGAPEAVTARRLSAASPPASTSGRKEANAGTATQAPSPRRKWRRLRPARLWATI